MSHSIIEDCLTEKDPNIVTAVNDSRESEFSGIEHADDDKKPNAEDNKNVSTPSAKNNSENFVRKGENVSQKVNPQRSMCEGKNKTSSEPIKSTGSSVIKKKGKRRKGKTTVNNEFLLTRKHVRYLLRRINFEQNLIDAYSHEGWQGLSLEKIRPETELERAKFHILQCKLRIRDTFQHLDSLLSVGKLEENLFDDDGQIDSEDIFCAECVSKDLSVDNDIILCDGNCCRGFHQKCLNPPLPTEEIPPEDEGWLCPACDCKVDCLDLLNEFQGSDLSIEDTWEKVFPEAAGVVNGHEQFDDSNYSSDDSEDFDYNPDTAPEGSSDGPEEGSSSEESYSTSLSKEDIEMPGCTKIDDVDLPSDDSEDDDYDPERSNPNNDAQNEGFESNESDFTSDSDDFCAELSKMNANEVSSSFSNYKLLDGPDGAWDAAQKISTNVVPPPVMETDASQENTCSKSKKRHREEAYGKASSSSSEDEVWSHKATSKKLKKDAIRKDSAKFLHARTQSASSQGASSIKGKVMQDDDMAKIGMADLDQSRVSEAINDSTPDRTHLTLGGQHGGVQKRVTCSSPRNFSPQAYQKLREAFKENQYPSRETKANLAEELGATVKKISKWFENARHSFRVSAKRSNLPGTSSTKADRETKCPGTSTPNEGRTLTETAENSTNANEWNAKNTTLVTEGTGGNNVEGIAKNAVANGSSGNTEEGER